MYRGSFEDDWDRPVEEVSEIILRDSAKDATMMHTPWDPFNIELILVQAQPEPKPNLEIYKCTECGMNHIKGHDCPWADF